MKYERFMKRNQFGVSELIQCSIDCFGEICDDCRFLQKALDRLAELEDKIESGRLLELPCKVGDEVYIVAKQGLDIYAVEKVIVCDLWYSPTDNCLYPMTADECPLSEIFPTRAEAEKKLAELKGE